MSDIVPSSKASEVFQHHCPHLMDESARSVFERIQLSCPSWLRILIGLRSSVLKPLGFEIITLDSFTILEEDNDHLVLAFEDKFFSSHIHLRIERDFNRLTLTNDLTFFNKAGEWYFKLTKPLHELILKQLLDNL